MSLIPRVLVRFGEYQIDRGLWSLTWRGEPIALNRKTFDLLLYLIDHAPRVVGKDELLKALWPESFVEDSNLTQHIFLLRKALSKHESDEKIIVTVPGRGYCFSSALEIESPPEQEIVVATHATVTRVTVLEDFEDDTVGPEVPGVLALPPPPKSQVPLYIGGAILLVVLAVAGWFGWHRWEDQAGGPPVQVVLADLDGGTGDPILDRALIDAMRIDLGQSPFVTVVSSAIVRRTLTEMTYKADDPVTASVARDICERTGSQAVLRGAVAKSGERYLLTEQVTSCVDGAQLAGARGEADKPEDLSHAVEKLAETLRLRLGESRRTIARFNMPLVTTTTSSLEALEDFSQAVLLSDRGKTPQAIELLKQAVALDPKFTAAYLNLATFYGNTGDAADDRVYIQKAYELRDQASAPVRMSIVAQYHSAVTGDLYESERNLRAWTDLYPRSVAPWVNLGDVERQLGRHNEAVIAYERALALSPRFLVTYYGLAMEQMHSGNLAAAKETSEMAIARNLDGDLIRMNLFRIGCALGDEELVAQQVAWGESHPDSPFLIAYESARALNEGRLTDARKLLDRMADVLRRQGVESAANRYFQGAAGAFADFGAMDEARSVLHVAPVDPNEYEQVRALAEVGDSATAAAMLRDQMAKHPQSTAWNQIYGPWLRADFAILAHKPQEAITALERTRAFDQVGFDGHYFRGKAYLEDGQPARAETEFREIIDHPYIDPIGYQLPMAWLQLGRAQGKQGNRVGAAESYKHFLSLWSKADPEAALLVQAKREAAAF